MAAIVRRHSGTATLLALRKHRPEPLLPLPDGSTYTLPLLDPEQLHIEAELLLDWYWPAAFGAPVAASVRDTYQALWSEVFARLLKSLSYRLVCAGPEDLVVEVRVATLLPLCR